MSAVASQSPSAGEQARNQLPHDPTRPSGSRYIREFDGLRGLSIALVIVYHCWGYGGSGILGNAINFFAAMGWCGVDIFFVLSGFLITGILLDTRHSPRYWRNFFIRRGLRIFPLYYAVLAVMIVNAWMLTHWGIGIPDKSATVIDKLWINLLYLPNFAMAIHGSNYVPMNIAWSLAIEEQFYLLFPAILLICSTRTLTGILIAAVVLAPLFRVVAWAMFPQPDLAPYVLPFCRMDSLALGALMQIVLRSKSAISYWMASGVALLLTSLAIGLMMIWGRADLPFVVVGYSLNAMAAAAVLLVVLLSAESSPLRTMFGHRALVYVGKLAYGLYLLHMVCRAAFDWFFLHLFPNEPLTHAWVSGVRLIGVFAISILVATVSFYLFEMPILRLKDRFAPSHQRYQEPVTLTG